MANTISSLMVFFNRLQLDDLGSEESRACGTEDKPGHRGNDVDFFTPTLSCTDVTVSHYRNHNQQSDTSLSDAQHGMSLSVLIAALSDIMFCLPGLGVGNVEARR